MGKLLLGCHEDRLIGDPDRKDFSGKVGEGDDRHVVTVAGSRSGKSSTVLIPNLLRYPGSVIVIDPKGELATRTAQARASMGQQVFVLDPYETSGFRSGNYNPLDELDQSSATFIDDAALVADALIIGNEKDPYWTDAARNLIDASILYMAATKGELSLPRLRRLLLGGEGTLGRPESDRDNPDDYLFVRMAVMDAFDGLLALLGRALLQKTEKEMGSILSTAREQLKFLDSPLMGAVLKSSDLRIQSIKHCPTTVYLCLPASRLATHFRWLRLVVTLALIELERDPTVPVHPVLFLLEEFAALEYMRPIERAVGFLAGHGVRLWAVLQDLSQLRTAYPKSWETFLGNAGVLQAFGNSDLTTTEYLSRRLGQTQYLHMERGRTSSAGIASGNMGYNESLRDAPLLASSEITFHLARETNRQMLLVPGRPPIYCDRLRAETIS
ncbi:type IV secretory system conjugative DNA transfer family protein [uncultured Bradyrhizobium sp.]|uniref:type IV secretory system conjugative DNA transfer family protein n=1 Tax=uncultured Bradyrhizobium sp. TaxID=199684 RepID=UPI0035C99AEF